MAFSTLPWWHPMANAAAKLSEVAKRVRLFRDWKQHGIWKRIHDTLRARVRRCTGRHKHPTGACSDSQSVKTTVLSGNRGFDKAKLINGGCRGQLLDEVAVRFRFQLKIVLRPQERNGFTLTWFNHHRQFSKDHESHETSYETIIYIVMIRTHAPSLGSPMTFSKQLLRMTKRQYR